jgi:hypothetical protein
MLQEAGAEVLSEMGEKGQWRLNAGDDQLRKWGVQE